MTKSYQKAAALALAAAMVLGGCSSNGTTTTPDNNSGDKTTAPSTTPSKEESKADKNSIKDLILTRLASGEMETFVAVHSQRNEDGEILMNMNDTLLEPDEYGRMTPCIAESWGSEDGGVTWKFNLRDGVKWVDINANEKADCTATDFATGLEFVLNFHKNDSINTSMPIELIKGAKEYYEWTKTLSPEEGKTIGLDKFFEMVGMETPDDHTVIYTCVAPKPYFDSVARYACLYPVPQGMIDELGGVDAYLACNNENMWYNGAYFMTSYVQGNEKVLEPNPTYWDTECKRFDSVTIRMVESSDIIYQLYQSGEIDHVDLGESNLKTLLDNPSNELYGQLVEKRPEPYSHTMHFNFDKHLEDGSVDTNWNTAIANKAFRQSWYYGIDFTNYFKRFNSVNPLKCENNFYTMKDFVYAPDGRDYTELVREKLGLGTFNGETPVRYNADKAAELKKQAMEELSAEGVTFPVEIDYYVSGGNQAALDNARIMEQVFTDSLGSDYVKFNIKTYVNSMAQEVRDPRLQSFAISGWGADYADPNNFLSQEIMGNDIAFYATAYLNINDVQEIEATKDLLATFQEYTDLVYKADAISDDMTARYDALATAEAYMLDNALAIPVNYDIKWALTHLNGYSYTGFKLKDWETSQDPYTTEQYDEFAKIYAENSTK